MDYYSGIFKGNDIRGSYPNELNEDVAFKIGQSLVKYLACKNVALGRDIRLSSESLFQALSEGIISNGAEVIDLGLVSTDAFYFAVGKFGFEAGVMITASHNPPSDNGFKICKKGAIMLYEDNGLQVLQNILTSNNFVLLNVQKGEIVKQNIHNDYLKHLLSFIQIKNIKPFHLAIDTSNGMAGLIIEEIVSRLSLRPHYLNLKLDGTFPHHLPNSNNPKALKQLSEVVLKKQLDLGVIFDGDADRVAFIDEKGKFVEASTILALFIKHFLPSNPKARVVYDSASSLIIKETILKYQGIPIRSPIGHSFMKATMRENDALLGGEHTGHFYFKENFYSDSGMIAFLVLLEILSQNKKTLSELVKETNPYFHSQETNYQQNEGYEKKLIQVEKYYLDKGMTVEHYDGIIIQGKDFWIHLHPAHTEPFIRTNIEAHTQSLLKEKEQELQLIFSQVGLLN
ncbi:MAG: phosphomannomutase/phosphoglucomutase [Minisyncoccia bacterium]